MAENKRKYWLHRITGGVNGTILSYPLLRNYKLISIGWSFLSSQEVAKDIQERGEVAIREAYDKEGASWSRNAYSLLNFVYRMHADDIVVVPMGASINIYRFTDEKIYTNDNIPDDYLEKVNVIKHSDGLSTRDGQEIDLGFYRKVEPVVLNIPRSQVDKDLYKKAKAFQTNLNISDVSKSVNKLISQAEEDATPHNLNSANIITDFEIKNYKNINDIHLKDLRQVNLFVGKNNVGKSNLLEAISLYANNWSLKGLLQILGNRKEKTDDFVKSAFNQSTQYLLNNFAPVLPFRATSFFVRDTNNTIVLGNKDGYLQLALMNAYFRNDAGTEANRLYQLTPYSSRTSKISSNVELVLTVVKLDTNNSTASAIRQDVSTKIVQLIQFTKSGLDYTNYVKQDRERACQLISCKSLSTELAQQLWADFSLTNKEYEVLDALKLIDDQIEDFNFIHVESRIVPMVKINKKGQYIRMPVSELGDGLVHVLNIIVALLSCSNGVLLLDEVESGLHYTTQMKLWQLIFKLADQYNVQIFATTHSNDCLNAFAKNAQNNQAIMFRLNKVENGIIAMPFSEMDRIGFALDNNIDLR